MLLNCVRDALRPTGSYLSAVFDGQHHHRCNGYAYSAFYPLGKSLPGIRNGFPLHLAILRKEPKGANHGHNDHYTRTRREPCHPTRSVTSCGTGTTALMKSRPPYPTPRTEKLSPQAPSRDLLSSCSGRTTELEDACIQAGSEYVAIWGLAQ